MIAFFSNIYQLIFSGSKFVEELFHQSKDKLLFFSITFLFFISACEYISFSYSLSLISFLDTLGYILFFFIYYFLTIIVIFIESSIINIFVNKSNNDSFGFQEIFSLYVLSSFPFIFLPSLSLFVSLISSRILGGLIFLCLYLFIVLLSIFYRYKFFRIFKKNIEHSIFYILMIPVIIWVLIFLTMSFSGFFMVRIFAETIEDLLKQILTMLFFVRGS